MSRTPRSAQHCPARRCSPRCLDPAQATLLARDLSAAACPHDPSIAARCWLGISRRLRALLTPASVHGQPALIAFQRPFNLDVNRSSFVRQFSGEQVGKYDRPSGLGDSEAILELVWS